VHIFYLLISNLGHSYLSRVTPGRFVTLITIPLLVLIHEVIKHKYYDCQYDKVPFIITIFLIDHVEKSQEPMTAKVSW
jgi:hypothetical protein